MSVIVTGASGQLGNALKLALDNPVMWRRENLDLADLDAVTGRVADAEADLLINCAAYTAVDHAEVESELAFRINTEAVQAIVRGCDQADTRLIQISTDYVFSGQPSAGPYWTLADTPKPRSVYGRSKLLGEQAALDYLHGGVVRTSWVFGNGRNFVRTMRALGRTRDSVEVVDDQIGRPTYAADLAAAIKHIAALQGHGPRIWQVQNAGQAVSWAELAEAIFDLDGTSCQVKRISTAEYAERQRSAGQPFAARPECSVFDLAPLETKDFTMRHWHEALADYLSSTLPPT